MPSSDHLKVLLSVGFGPWSARDTSVEVFWRLVDRSEALGLDSIWLTDRVVSAVGAKNFVLDPLIALAGIAARTKKLKLGTSVYVLPLRNPVVAAKELASIDFLSGGRMLLAVGVGNEEEREFEACGVPKAERGGRLDEAMPLMRKLWTGAPISHDGRYFHLHDVVVDPPVVGAMPIWLGGHSDATYRRLGRLGDGWLPSGMRPDEIADGIPTIQAYAAKADRAIDADHFGAVLTFLVASSREEALRQAKPYLVTRRADVAADEFTALGTVAECVGKLEGYVKAGASKFVLRPLGPPESYLEQLDALAELQAAFD